MNPGRLIVSALALVSMGVWGALVVSGAALLRNLEGRHLPGAPNAAQVQYYLLTPAAVLIVLVFAGLWWLRTGKRRSIVFVSALSLLVLPAYILFYTGGV